MLIKIWPGNLNTQLKRMNHKVDEDNGKASNKGNVSIEKFVGFPAKKFWKNIGCLVSAPT